MFVFGWPSHILFLDLKNKAQRYSILKFLFIESEALITLAGLVPLLSCQIGMAVHKRGKTTNPNILQTYMCYLTWNVLKWLGDRVTIVCFWWQQPKNRCQLATTRLQAIVCRRFSPTQLGGLEFHVREISHACCF